MSSEGAVPLRVLIVSENVSMKMGGEASLPFYYAKLFLQRGIQVRIACHDRVRDEVVATFGALGPQLHFVRDTPLQVAIFKLAGSLPNRLRHLVNGQLIHYLTQYRIRRIARKLAREGAIDVVFEPAPITPKGLSFMYGLGVPVVIGPMCGGMSFPPAFRAIDSWLTSAVIDAGRWSSHLANRLVPGKLNAAVLMVANQQTEAALPTGVKGRVLRVFESGVDLDIWRPAARPAAPPSDVVRFMYSGRFVDLKGIQYLVPAFKLAAAEDPRCVLELVGGGGEFEAEVLALCADPAISSRVRLHGWVTREQAATILREADVFLMPSLRECGGTAILEAMALGKPVIATRWGGPADYVNQDCGVLVEPDSETGFIEGLKRAILQLTRSASLRQRLGEGGKARVRQDYLSWDAKADRVAQVLTEAVSAARRAR